MRETIVDFIRHGEPLGGHMYRGQRDDPLSERGWLQMRQAVGVNCPWQMLVSSPLQRCAAFAEEMARRHGLALRIDPDLCEVGFGDWEGCTKAQLEALSPGVVERFYDDPVGQRPNGAEPLHDFRIRVGRAWSRLLEQGRERHVLVVAHAGVIRMAVTLVLDLPLGNLYRLEVPNAGLTRVAVNAEGRPRLIFHAGSLPENP